MELPLPKFLDDLITQLMGYSAKERPTFVPHYEYLNRTAKPTTSVDVRTKSTFREMTPQEKAYARSQGYTEEPADSWDFARNTNTDPAPLNEKKTWENKQTFQFEPFKRKTDDRLGNIINEAINRNMNRLSMKAVRVAEKTKLVNPNTANRWRRQIRNTAREDLQELPGTSGKSYPTFVSPYKDAMEAAEQTKRATQYFGEDPGFVDEYLAPEYYYQRKSAAYYNPNNKYKNIRSGVKGALLAYPFVNAAFNDQTKKSLSKRKITKSIDAKKVTKPTVKRSIKTSNKYF